MANGRHEYKRLKNLTDAVRRLLYFRIISRLVVVNQGKISGSSPIEQV